MLHLLKDTRGQGAMMITVVVGLLVSIAIGILVWFKLSGPIVNSIHTGMPSSTSASWNASILAVNNTANTTFTLMPIVAIVLIASAILFIVSGFGRQGI